MMGGETEALLVITGAGGGADPRDGPTIPGAGAKPCVRGVGTADPPGGGFMGIGENAPTPVAGGGAINPGGGFVVQVAGF